MGRLVGRARQRPARDGGTLAGRGNRHTAWDVHCGDPGGRHLLLTIGELSRRSGKAASAIRYYEEIGLLPSPERAEGRRRYPAAVVRTLAVIDTAQRAGLTLDEIRLLLTASPGNRAATERLRDVAVRKLPEVDEAIARAEIVRGWLQDAARCECPTLDDCPLFDEPARLPERSRKNVSAS